MSIKQRGKVDDTSSKAMLETFQNRQEVYLTNFATQVRDIVLSLGKHGYMTLRCTGAGCGRKISGGNLNC